MSDVALSGGMRRTVEVEMTTIDNFLPSDLTVDLVKIDVEGHEPLVLRGMERTIARSPNIRIVMEFADNLLAQQLSRIDGVGQACGDREHAFGVAASRFDEPSFWGPPSPLPDPEVVVEPPHAAAAGVTKARRKARWRRRAMGARVMGSS